MIIDVVAAEVLVGDVLSDGRRVERARTTGGMTRLAVRRPSWRCRKLVALDPEAPVRVWRADSIAS